MIKKITLLLLLLPIFLKAQVKIDTVLVTPIYKSYFSYKLKEPVFLYYKLYKGGGDCSREGFRFKNDTKIETATLSDYEKTGYDQGHLANAKDFAYNCVYDELTFRFYNCLPQSANLNRGIWKRWETTIREESQTDSILVICGAEFGTKKIGKDVAVPDFCWKITKSLSSGKVTHVLWFENLMKDAKGEEITLDELQKRIKYKVSLVY